ncbi:MAG: hypothetical protein WCA89_04960 [Terracidiphilus sp.]|jgi:uncharacterized membrane protein
MSDQNQSGFSENSLGALAYVTFVPAIFFLAIAPYNKKRYVRFHAWQSLVFCVFTSIIIYALSYCLAHTTSLGPSVFLTLSLWLAWLVPIAFFIAWVWCVVSALNGKLFKLPLIGAWAEKQANK